MTSPVVTVLIDSSVADVLKIMRDRNIRRIVVTYPDGTPFRVVTNRDILRNIENSYLEYLNRKIRHAREVLDFIPEVIFEVIDVAGEQVIQWCNRKTKQVFGRDLSNEPVISLISSDTWKALYPVIAGDGRLERARIEIGERTFELSASYMKMQREGLIQAILMDITSEVLLSTRDFLTGVVNRRKFDELYAVEIARVRRYGRYFSLAIIDIDHFKLVNDTFGHLAGDKVLRELVELTAKYIREVDTLARYGGEEFVLMAPNTDLAGMNLLAEKLRQIIGSHVFDGQRRITVSIGVGQYAMEESPEAFIGRVDAALYRAKGAGRNRVERSERQNSIGGGTAG